MDGVTSCHGDKYDSTKDSIYRGQYTRYEIMHDSGNLKFRTHKRDFTSCPHPAGTRHNNNVILTSKLATSFRRNNDTIIMLCVRWGKGELCDVFCEFLEKNDRVISRAPYSNGKMINHPLQLVSVTLSAEYMTSVRMVYLRPLNSCEPSCHSGCSNTNTSPVSAEWWEN